MKPQRNSRPREMMEIFLFCGVLLGCANIWCSLLWMVSYYNHGKDASDHRETVSAAAPSPSGAAEQLHGNSSAVGQGEGWVRNDSSTLHVLCTLFLLLLYQLHLRSSDIKSWRWGTPGLLKDFSLLYECPAMFTSHAPGFNSLVDGGKVNFFDNCGS